MIGQASLIISFSQMLAVVVSYLCYFMAFERSCGAFTLVNTIEIREIEDISS